MTWDSDLIEALEAFCAEALWALEALGADLDLGFRV